MNSSDDEAPGDRGGLSTRRGRVGKRRVHTRDSLEGLDGAATDAPPTRSKQTKRGRVAPLRCVWCQVESHDVKTKTTDASTTVNAAITTLQAACVTCNPPFLARHVQSAKLARTGGDVVHVHPAKAGDCIGWKQIAKYAKQVRVRAIVSYCAMPSVPLP